MKPLLIIGVVLVLAYEYMKAQQAGVPVASFPKWIFFSQLGFGPGSGKSANNLNRFEYGGPNASHWQPVDGPNTFFYGKTYQRICPAGATDPSECKTVLVNTSIYDQSPFDASSGGGCAGGCGGGGAIANPGGASQSWLTHL